MKFHVPLIVTLLICAALEASASDPSKLRVVYSSSDAKVTSQRCIDSYRSNYGFYPHEVHEAPVARLFKADKNADVFLCIPPTNVSPGLKKLPKGEVNISIGYFIKEGIAKKDIRCATLNGMQEWKLKYKTQVLVTSSHQLLEMLKLDRINCVFIVNEDFRKLLEKDHPTFKYRYEEDAKLPLNHYSWEPIFDLLVKSSGK
jgi:hypothetical protein